VAIAVASSSPSNPITIPNRTSSLEWVASALSAGTARTSCKCPTAQATEYRTSGCSSDRSIGKSTFSVSSGNVRSGTPSWMPRRTTLFRIASALDLPERSVVTEWIR
jgi:hypothetical protein